MKYQIGIKPSCRQSIKKLCRRNPVLEKALSGKMEDILLNPYRFKPLMHDLAGIRRVHIMKSFVLAFEIDESEKTVVFLSFCHHDEAYRR